MNWRVLEGDCREAMGKLGDGSVDSVVTDPPYELGFMGKDWDRTGIAYQVDVWREVHRVLKPGGHLVAAGGSRTHHRLACAIEDAGFELRDTVCHVFGTGFPKSLSVGKAIDAEAGVQRESDYQPNFDPPITEAAKRWEGWGTALKPAAEYWTVARKPLEGTVAQNILRHGTGGLNVDGCRVPGSVPGTVQGQSGNMGTIYGDDQRDRREFVPDVGGRWPPNLVLSHSPDCGEDCAPSCPVAQMDRQSGERSSGKMYPTNPKGRDGRVYRNDVDYTTMETYGDSGGASRFFPCFRYEAKATRAERDAGLAGLPRKTGGELTGRKDGSAGLDSPRAGAGRTASFDSSKIVCYVGPRWVKEVLVPALQEVMAALPQRDIGGFGLPQKNGIEWSMCVCGSPSTDPFQPDIRRIIKTEIGSITESRILKSFQQQHTNGCMAVACAEVWSGSSPAESAASLSPWAKKIGISAEKDGRSTDDVDLATSVRSWLTSEPGGGGRGVGVRNTHPT